MKPHNDTFDVIVIGSGIGALCTAALLARIGRRRVLVLERHSEIGGLTHVFARGRFKWDVGVHYVGKMRPGTLQRAIFDFITDGLLDWRALPDPFERFIFPGVDFRVPHNHRHYIRQLCEQFPAHRRAIRGYFREVNLAAHSMAREFLCSCVPAPLRALLHLLNVPRRALALQTTEHYLESRIGDPVLRAVLAAQWGDYGAPPGESCFAIHATIVNHYLDGAFAPQGGAAHIAATIEQVIERFGGTVLVNREVTGVIVENGVAVGVRALDCRQMPPTPVEYRAAQIISNTGAGTTFTRLLSPKEGGAATRAASMLTPGYSAVTLFVGLSEAAATLGVQGENLWINETLDHNDVALQTRRVVEGAPTRCYVSFPSMRSGESGRHTATVIAVVDHAAFDLWSGQPWRHRDPEYYALKERISQGLISLVERHLPGFARLVTFHELATPLSMEHFTNRAVGSMYGFRPTPQRYAQRWFGVRTPVCNLLLSGSDVCTVGVVGALMGGVAAAGVALGRLGFIRVVAAVRRQSRLHRLPRLIDPRAVRAVFRACSDKLQARLDSRQQLTDSIFELTYRLDRTVSFTPGQYARIQYGSADYGSYSIAGGGGDMLQFIIDVRFGGMYKEYFSTLQPGDHSVIRLPLGDFVLKPTAHRKVFISTGTGFAPQLPMIEQLDATAHDETIDVIFGCRNLKDLFVQRYLQRLGRRGLKINTCFCLSREQVPGHVFGRVTQPLDSLTGNLHQHDFYISGNPAMVAEVSALLLRKGAVNVFTETY